MPAAQKLRKDELEKVILVNEYVRLNRRETTYRRVPSGRYINFLSDLMARIPGKYGRRRSRLEEGEENELAQGLPCIHSDPRLGAETRRERPLNRRWTYGGRGER